MKSIGLWLLSLALLVLPGSVLASPERLEADLRAMFGETGTFEIGDVSSPMLSFGSRVVADTLIYDSGHGERVLVDRYTVRGDYDAPDAVMIDGLRVEDTRSGLTVVSVETLNFEEPSHAVFPLQNESLADAWRTEGLSVDNLAIDLASDVAMELFHDTPWADGRGRLNIARIEGRELAADRIGLLEANELSGEGENLGELGSGSFRLASLRLVDARNLDIEEEARVGELLLSDMVIDTDRLVGAFERLRVDGDTDDGEGGVWLDAMHLDLNRMVELAPVDQRTQMRMFSNVLTDGTGELDLDVAFEGRWTAEDDMGSIMSHGVVDMANALHLRLDMDLPVAVPTGMEPAAYFAGLNDFEDMTLLGGDIILHLEEQGLFGRIAPVGAAMAGISEQQFIERARTQAQGFGMVLGDDVKAILMALVGMLEGNVSELTISASLPPNSNLDSYREDPLGLSEQLSIRVESR
ncbi:hypothetical protein L861_11610 [Litchfieldella anticariensis FP35 = DSM 16096]|uniref:Uncharacterized protein n=1 Tax=Litchfieldella anticariensis (strain DSM 16096 / CECT 5854 / CIP 108499 / LMG 22089 / FP35) TaxID=1121939 RepID=S2L0M4_LITA3|nr:hypothetical protein [Halomonas anticariensis]EPC01214.1 hypothetical protein L861_11610 [Halomonas anticariensis FP35 = DSM 16096]